MADATLVDLVKITALTTGTGAVTLGDAVPGYRGVEALLDGAVYGYSIQQEAEYEIGRCTYLLASNQIVRTPEFTSNGGVPINLQANASIAFVATAEDILGRDVLRPLYGYGAPTNNIGLIGQTYTDKNEPVTLYGPKTASGWGVGVTLQGGNGKDGEAGPAGPTFDTLAKFRAAPSSNKRQSLKDPAYPAGDYFFQNEGAPYVERLPFVIKATDTPLSVGAWVQQMADGVAYKDPATGAVPRSVAARVREAGVSIYDFGAVGETSTDSTAAIVKASQVASDRKQPLVIPPGQFVLNDTIQPKGGIIGASSALSLLLVTDRQAFVGGKNLVRIGWRKAEDPALAFALPCRGFSAYGAGIRTGTRSSDPASIMFQGNGVFLDEQAHSVDVNDVHTEFFYRNLDFGGVYGHLSATNLVSANGWFNVYFSRNAFDYKLYNATITGSLFACIGASGVNDTSLEQAVGGLGGLTMFGGHTGFAPYGIVVETGTGTIGLRASTFIDARFEFIGNRAIWVVNDAKNNGILDFKSQGHSWSRDGNNNPDPQYSIVGDGNYVAQDYAVVMGNVGGDSAPSYRRGVQWVAGSSGKHTKLGTLLDFWHDDRGIGGYEVANGRERLIFSGQFGYVGSVGVAGQTITATPGLQVSLGTMPIPEAYDGTSQGRIVLAGLVAESTDVMDVQLRVKINGGGDIVVGIFSLRAGSNNIPTEFMAFDIGRRVGDVHTVQVILQFSGGGTIELNNKGLGGQVRLLIGQNGGVA